MKYITFPENVSISNSLRNDEMLALDYLSFHNFNSAFKASNYFTLRNIAILL